MAGDISRTFESCANCGANFQQGVKYPAQSEEDENGDTELYSFCDYVCMQNWIDSTS